MHMHTRQPVESATIADSGPGKGAYDVCDVLFSLLPASVCSVSCSAIHVLYIFFLFGGLLAAEQMKEIGTDGWG